MSRQYITTAIDYPNAAPHMGHVLEKVLADVVARWCRLRGDEVRFQVGTDEHGVKIQQAAKAADKAPAVFVKANRRIFVDLYHQLQISFDEPFMHTSDNPMHTQVVQELWRRLDRAGVLEKRSYKGLYCSGCEKFVTKKELVDGKCPDHGVVPEEVEEENYFFLLSRDTAWLKTLLRSDYRIVPSFRENETMSLLEQGLEDVSFSRPTSSLSWGIPVPGDDKQTMYVWCDALTNYISGLNYFGDPDTAKMWWSDAAVTHVIGKDIARFHALIWPAMLHHGGIRTPDRLLIHGFLTSEGQKMSKSLGNVVVPQEVIAKYGVDALRFYLSHEIPVGNDGDFSWKRFGELYDAVLRNTIGNLLNRVLVLLRKDGGHLSDVGEPIFITARYADYRDAMNQFDVSRAVHMAVSIAVDSNKFIDAKKPWELEKGERLKVLSQLAEAVRHLSLSLLPVIPDTAQRISKQLGVPYADRMLNRDFVITKELKEWGSQKGWQRVGEPQILFPPLL